MRGPIDYVVVGFVGNKFDGSIMKELGAAVESGSIGVLDLAIVVKDKAGGVTKVEAAALGDEIVNALAGLNIGDGGLIGDDDVAEIGDVLDPDCSAGLLIIEHLWAKPLKQAIINANGVLLAEGRIHPEAAAEIK